MIYSSINTGVEYVDGLGIERHEEDHDPLWVGLNTECTMEASRHWNLLGNHQVSQEDCYFGKWGFKDWLHLGSSDSLQMGYPWISLIVFGYKLLIGWDTHPSTSQSTDWEGAVRSFRYLLFFLNGQLRSSQEFPKHIRVTINIEDSGKSIIPHHIIWDL